MNDEIEQVTKHDRHDCTAHLKSARICYREAMNIDTMAVKLAIV